MKPSTWTIPVYGDVVVWYKDRSKMHSELSKACSLPEDNFRQYNGILIELERKGDFFFALGVFNKSNSTLAHECAHLCFEVLKRHGVKVDADNDEAFCYLLDTCMDEGKRRLGIR